MVFPLLIALGSAHAEECVAAESPRVWPVDGAEGVPLDARLWLSVDAMDDVQDTIELRSPAGPVEIGIEPRGSAFALFPTEPLLQDTTYRLVEVAPGAPDSGTQDPISSFRTGALLSPAILAAPSVQLGRVDDCDAGDLDTIRLTISTQAATDAGLELAEVYILEAGDDHLAASVELQPGASEHAFDLFVDWAWEDLCLYVVHEGGDGVSYATSDSVCIRDGEVVERAQSGMDDLSEEPTGCSSRPGQPLGAAALFMALMLGRRRARQG